MDTEVLLASLYASSISVGKTVAIVGVGFALCRSRLKGGRQTIRDVTQILVFFLSPCLMITSLCGTLTLDDMRELWILPVFSYILAATGAAVGWGCGRLFDPTQRCRPVAIASCACGNGFSLPLSMAGALSFTVDWIRDDPKGDRLYAFIFLYVVTAGTIMYGPVYYMLGQPPLTAGCNHAVGGGRRGAGGSSSGGGAAGAVGAAATSEEESQTLLPVGVQRVSFDGVGAGSRDGDGDDDDDDDDMPAPAAPPLGSWSPSSPTPAQGCSVDWRPGSMTASVGVRGEGRGAGCWRLARKVVNPPLLASFCGVTLAMVGPLREAMVGSVLFDTMQGEMDHVMIY
jgi:predicted permease